MPFRKVNIAEEIEKRKKESPEFARAMEQTDKELLAIRELIKTKKEAELNK